MTREQLHKIFREIGWTDTFPYHTIFTMIFEAFEGVIGQVSSDQIYASDLLNSVDIFGEPLYIMKFTKEGFSKVWPVDTEEKETLIAYPE